MCGYGREKLLQISVQKCRNRVHHTYVHRYCTEMAATIDNSMGRKCFRYQSKTAVTVHHTYIGTETAATIEKSMGSLESTETRGRLSSRK